MSNYKKTLADVQPGGRVRLGDGLPPLPKAGYVTGGDFGHEAHNAFTPEQMREYALAALSAQPSPGGQGDALKALDDLAAFCSDDAATVDRHVAVIRAALAARQPVGQEPAFFVNRWEMEHGTAPGLVAMHTGKHLGIRDFFTVPLYAAPTAQADQEYLESLDRALGGVIDQRDRYHEVADELAAHIASITGVDIGEHSSANCPWQNAIEAAEEFKPAQAVDLGAVREALQAAEGLATVCASVDGYSREEVAASGRAMKQQFADALAKVDSQAVGNG